MGRVLRVEGGCVLESDDLDAEYVQSWSQSSGDGDVKLWKIVQNTWPPIGNTGKVYLSSVVQQLIDGPNAIITLMEDLGPNVTDTVRASKCEVRSWSGSIRDTSDICTCFTH
jgi:hypothetical protein